MWVAAFMLCIDIGCPHPRYLAQHGVGPGELIDWWAFYLWRNRQGDDKETNAPVQMTTQDQIDTLRHFKELFDQQ